MELLFQTTVNALILAAAYILVALGFAFLFNMLSVLNLAHGAIYMIAGYLAYAFIVGLGMNNWIAMLLSTLIVASLGVFIERWCFRPFVTDFNRMVMICVAITVILTTSVNILIGTQQMAIPTFAEGAFRAGVVSVNWDRAITFCIGTAILVLTTFFVNRTRWGRQMQAISQNLEGAALQGISIGRISAIACGGGFALAAIAGCLMGTLYNLSPFMGQSTLVKVLMIIILAGVGSFGGIFIVGLILGVLYGVLPVVLPGAASDAVAVVIFMVILLLRPQGFFGHEAAMGETPPPESASRAGEAKRRRWLTISLCAAAVILLTLFPFLTDSPYMMHIFNLTFLYIIVSVSLRTIAVSGQFPLAHGAFMGIGAYASGMAVKWLGLSPWLTIPCGGIIASGLAMLFGYPFARLRTLYYAMGMLFLGVGVTQIISAGGILTGGYSGLTGIPPLFLGPNMAYYCYYLFLGLSVVCVLALYRFEFSRIGMNLKAIAQSHLVASSVGINEGAYRVLAVGVGSFFVGLAGALYAHYGRVLSPTSFDLTATLWLVMYVLIGGIGSFVGPIIGTAILVLIPEFFRSLKMYSPYISAGILLIVVYLMPGGLASLPGVARAFRSRRKEAKRVVYAPGD